MAKFGYARVSSEDQDTEIQKVRLREAGCDVVRAEKVSGKSLAGRDILAELMEFIREGDELVVVRLDRLGRNTRDVLNLVHQLEVQKAFLTVLEPTFSTRDPTGHLLVTVLGMVSELERKFIGERQRAGIDAAKVRGVYKGRKPSVSGDRLRVLRGTGMGPSEIAKQMGISRMHVYRLLKASGAQTETVCEADVVSREER